MLLIGGQYLVTGEPLAPWERIIGILPGISDVGKLASKAGDIARAVEGASDAAKAAAAGGDLAKAQKTADQADQGADLLEDIAPGSPEALSARQKADEATEAVKEETAPGTLIGNLNDINPIERSMVEELLGQGKTVEIVPRGSSKTPDFRIDGVSTELKTLTSAGSNTLKNAIQKAAQQGEQILVDARNVPITAENAHLQILRAQGNVGGLEGRVTVLTAEGPVSF